MYAADAETCDAEFNDSATTNIEEGLGSVLLKLLKSRAITRLLLNAVKSIDEPRKRICLLCIDKDRRQA